MRAIVVVGNMASGKTTLCKEIARISSKYKYVCVDEVRAEVFIKYRTLSGHEREDKCNELVLRKINGISDILYESTGSSRLFTSVYAKLLSQGYDINVVKLECSISECLRRFRNRKSEGYLQLRPGYKKNRTEQEYIEELSHKLRNIRADIVLNSGVLNAKNVFMELIISLKRQNNE